MKGNVLLKGDIIANKKKNEKEMWPIPKTCKGDSSLIK